jgi:hypothetical protein
MDDAELVVELGRRRPRRGVCVRRRRAEAAPPESSSEDRHLLSIAFVEPGMY